MSQWDASQSTDDGDRPNLNPDELLASPLNEHQYPHDDALNPSGIDGLPTDTQGGRYSQAQKKDNDAAYQLLSVEQVQKALKRSRASIYRYANTESGELNPPIDPNRLNPEPRRHKDDPLKFALSEVERFAKHVLGIRGITIEVQESPDYVNQELMKAILDELKAIRSLLEDKQR
jgi:hypothetical protein